MTHRVAAPRRARAVSASWPSPRRARREAGDHAEAAPQHDDVVLRRAVRDYARVRDDLGTLADLASTYYDPCCELLSALRQFDVLDSVVVLSRVLEAAWHRRSERFAHDLCRDHKYAHDKFRNYYLFPEFDPHFEILEELMDLLQNPTFEQIMDAAAHAAAADADAGSAHAAATSVARSVLRIGWYHPRLEVRNGLLCWRTWQLLLMCPHTARSAELCDRVVEMLTSALEADMWKMTGEWGQDETDSADEGASSATEAEDAEEDAEEDASSWSADDGAEGGRRRALWDDDDDEPHPLALVPQGYTSPEVVRHALLFVSSQRRLQDVFGARECSTLLNVAAVRINLKEDRRHDADDPGRAALAIDTKRIFQDLLAGLLRRECNGGPPRNELAPLLMGTLDLYAQHIARRRTQEQQRRARREPRARADAHADAHTDLFSDLWLSVEEGKRMTLATSECFAHIRRLIAVAASEDSLRAARRRRCPPPTIGVLCAHRDLIDVITQHTLMLYFGGGDDYAAADGAP